MKFILLSLFVMVSCSKRAEYDPRKLTAVTNPTSVNGSPRGYTNDVNKNINGTLPKGLTVSVHKNNTCSDVALASGSSEDFLAGFNYVLTEATHDIYLKITNSVQTICFNPNYNYIVDITNPQITLDPMISATPTDHIRSYLVKGVVSDNNGVPTLSFHKNSSCSDLALFASSQTAYNGAGVTLNSTVIDNLTTTPVYAKAVDLAGNSICQLLVSFTHITGPATNAPNSYFTIEKTLITPKLPIQSNEIKFFARDVNNNPVSGLSPVLVLTPELAAPITCNMVTTANPGEYLCTASIGENYSIDISSGSITFMTNRIVGNVIVTDNAYCYQNSGLAWINHKQVGDGSNATPYLICSAAQLKSLAETTDSNDLSKEYKLMIDLDLETFLTTATNEFSIGSGVTPFSGVFDGNDLKIENFKLKSNTDGFIKNMSAGSVKNLTFSYSTQTIGTMTSISPFISDISTSGNVTLDKLKIIGEVECQLADGCSVGGVVGTAFVSGAGQINMTEIDVDLQALNVTGNLAGVVVQSSSPTASKMILDKINSKVMYSNNGMSSGSIGGIITDSSGTTIRNFKSNLTVNIATAAAQNIAGVTAITNNTIIENGLVIGDVAINNDVQTTASIATQVSNFSSFQNLVGLLNVNGEDCTIECGKMIGSIYSLDNTFNALYTSDQTTFAFDTLANPQVIVESSIDLVASPGYFYNSANVPLNSWDFSTIWESVPSNFPELIFVD